MFAQGQNPINSVHSNIAVQSIQSSYFLEESAQLVSHCLMAEVRVTSSSAVQNITVDYFNFPNIYQDNFYP